MIDRRTLVGGSAAAVLLAGLSPTARSGAPLRVASVKYGTLAWLLETIKAEGLDKKHNLDLAVVEIASNQASPVTLYGGSADVIVSDWPWALRQRGMGEALKFSPFSASLGAVMVPENSEIKTLSDLKGKRLGVAGSAIDKSWLLLRAYTTKKLGADIGTSAVPQFGAAPLLAEQIKDGRLDAVLNFWTYTARLKGHGFRAVASMKEVLAELGIVPTPALVGFIWKKSSEAALGGAITAFLAAAAEGNQILATSDAAWERLRPQLKAQNEEEFRALVAGYRSGIPGPWTDAEMKAAETLMSLLIEGGDTDLVGNGTRFDPKLFYSPGT